MKRSEALEIIFNNLQLGYKNDELAEMILNDLEEAGMLPPSTYIPTFKQNDNSWEPEDG